LGYSPETLAAFHAAVENHTAPPKEVPHVVGHAGKPPGQGPFLRVYLVVEDGVIREAAHETYGCPACIACAHAVCELARGRTVEEAGRIDEAALTERVGQLPRQKRHCLGLAVGALRDALEKTRVQVREV